ncbi:helix-turn-helix domain-containing protein [Kitasatospora sp. NBC_00240]|uniref:PucR family transcriptional regulator n=1 Tax=Kitasatospora sp. NBC_00240 TaxID=2903567 RepID=UPI002257DD72|nr:helix-turn-helix domain-containing protein [Kitasatospora sp. NBC_00240]MCX5214721.1 helix-turn-helix domain-containing protein [Kitasatospora sp. NBC_00240]
MEYAIPPAWPVRRRMPDLAALDGPTRATVLAAVERLRALSGVFAARVLALVRSDVPGYAALSDDEIQASAHRFMDILVGELSALRVPDGALRDVLRAYALERVARGVPLDALAVGYQLGSREMLTLIDEVSAEVGLPSGLLLAVHDSTWEFANEASSVFARLQHDLALERAHFDAERRSAFAAGVLGGAFTAERIHRDAPLFGLDLQLPYVALAARAASVTDAEAVRRVIAAAVRVPADRLPLAQIGSCLGVIVPKAPEDIVHHLVAAGPLLPLDLLHRGFDEAVVALDTAERFTMTGLVRLPDLGPRPLVLSAARTAARLSARHLTALDEGGRSSREIEDTVRVYLDCDQDVRETSQRLAVHPNTVRYRVKRFQLLTGLDLRHTEELVTAWWLLNRRRPNGGPARTPGRPT